VAQHDNSTGTVHPHRQARKEKDNKTTIEEEERKKERSNKLM
jgi:hypothetical protein